MHAQQFFAIGLMSGTSLDGLDLVYVSFTNEKVKDYLSWSFKVINSKSVKYSSSMIDDLRGAVNFSALEITKLNTNYGKYLAEEVDIFIKEYKIEKVDVIGSHGHTVFHQPENGFTLQIGDASWINKKTKITVVSDFRTQDVVLGGQGAPLVPIGDKLLFSNYDFRINLGGFANISFQENDKTVAFDICAVNTVLNKYALKLGLDYDDKGKIASTGNLITEMLEDLNKIEFYDINVPKSLGVEWNNEVLYPILKKFDHLPIKDLLHTYCYHISEKILNEIKGKDKSVLISGGGAFNDFLINLIKVNTENTIVIANNEITDFKEAIIFAFLAVLRINNLTNCLAEVTGADYDHSSGVIINFAS